MPTSPITPILRAATRRPGEPLNILTFPTHERYETNLARTGHNFSAMRGQNIKDWKTIYAPIPDNYTLLDQAKGQKQVTVESNFDLVLSQNKFGQYQIAREAALNLGLPLVSLEHTLPHPSWPQPQIEAMKAMRGHVNVFISDYSIGQWRFDGDETVRVVRHCVDSDVFYNYGELSNFTNRQNTILSVVNDWINRDWCCGFSIWQRVTQNLPVIVVGDTKGLSLPAKNVDDLVKSYNNSKIFLNTSTISPVPTALLEAMSCGCACVSTATCMIPEIIEHGVNGFITNDENEMRSYLEQLLQDDSLATKMGENARRTIQEKFSVERFVNDWNKVFEEVMSAI